MSYYDRASRQILRRLRSAVFPYPVAMQASFDHESGESAMEMIALNVPPESKFDTALALSDILTDSGENVNWLPRAMTRDQALAAQDDWAFSLAMYIPAQEVHGSRVTMSGVKHFGSSAWYLRALP